jgi:hypothetical protein
MREAAAITGVRTRHARPSADFAHGRYIRFGEGACVCKFSLHYALIAVVVVFFALLAAPDVRSFCSSIAACAGRR